MGITYVKSSNFDKEVLEASGTVLVDFNASWCGPCRMLGPIVEQFAAANPDIKVCKIDIDSEQGLAMKYNVRSIPTLLVFRNGQVVNMSVGLVSFDTIVNLVK